MAEREIVVNLRLTEGNTREQFRAISAALIDVKQEVRDTNKALRDNAKEIKALDAAYRDGEVGAEQYAVAQQRLTVQREQLKGQAANLAASEAALSAQYREAKNEVGGLTEAQLRFRDKMAQASIEAIRQSGVLGQLGTRSEFLNSQITELRDAQSSLRSKMDAITEEAARQNEVIGSLASRSDALRSEMDALNTEYERGNLTQEQYHQGQAQLTAELNKVQGEIGQTNTKLDQLNAEYQQGKITQEQYAASQAKITTELNKVQAEIGQTNAKVDLLTKEFQQGKITADQFRAGISDINKGFDGIGGAINKSVADLKSFALGFVGVIAVAQGAIAAIRSIAGTIADFDQQLANIRSLGQEYAASINEIADAAVKLGPKLGVAPVEALKGFEALAKAGLTTQQILGGGLEASLTLAAAGTIEVGQAAELTASALTQFNLAGEDAGLVSDLLAKGANIAQGGVGDLGAALDQSGLVAAQFGLGVEETVGALTAFAQAGLIGSDAGTSFKTALLQLQSPTKQSKALLDQYGITLTNANGEFLSLAEIAGQLQTQLGDLTDAQRASALETIFGRDAIRVATILYREGADGINRYTKEVTDAGFAAGVQAEKQDSLSGATQRLTAAWDAFILSLDKGDGLVASTIRNIIEGTTGILEFFGAGSATDQAIGEFTQSVQEAYTEFGFLGQLSAERGDALTDSFRKAAEAARKYGSTEEDISLLIAARNVVIEKSRDIYAKYDNDRRKGTKTLTEEEKVQLAAAQAAIDSISDEIAKRGELNTSRKAGAQVAREEAETVGQARERITNALKDAKAAQDALAATDTVGRANAQKAIEALQKELDALDASGKRTRETTVNVAGSVADLTAQIGELRKQQQQATTSEQFATYQTQIDALTQSVDLLTGKLSQDLLDAAASIPQVQSTIDTLVPANRTAPLTPAAQATPDSPEQALKAQAEQQAASLTSLEEFYIARDTLSQFYSEQELARKEAELAADQAVNDAKLQGAQILAGAIASIAQEGSVAAQVAFGLQKALAVAEVISNLQRQIAAIRLSTSLASASVALGGPGAIAAVEATGIARIARAKVEAGLSIAQIVAQSIAGFAQGGYISGERVRPSHGKPIRRSNGDNRLVTVKTGEVVMNEEQQEELRRRAGSSIFRELGIPGFATGGTITRGTALVNASLPISLGNVANRVLQVQTNEANQALAERPIYVRVEEINKLQGRVAQVTELSRA